MVEGFGGKGWGRDVELKASCEMCLRIMQMQTIFFFFFLSYGVIAVIQDA